MKFPSFVRARKEQHLPPTDRKRSLVEQFRENPACRTINHSFAVVPVSSSNDRSHQWDSLLCRESCFREQFGAAMRAAQSMSIRGAPPGLSPLLSFPSPLCDSRLEKRLALHNQLLPLQSYAVPCVLESGTSVVVVGPPGSGKRSCLMYCACCIATKFQTEARKPSVLLVFSSNEDLHFCRRWFFGAVGEALKVVRFGVTEGEGSLGDICLATAFEIGDLFEQRPDDETNLENVRFCGIVGADRFVVPPLTQRLPLSCWMWLRRLCNDQLVTMVVGKTTTRTVEAGRMAIMGIDPSTQTTSPNSFVVAELLDNTAWTNVIHSVLLVEDDIESQASVLREMLSGGGEHQPLHIVVTSSKKESAELERQLGAAVTSDVNRFRQGQSSLLTTEWISGGLTDIPALTRVVINVGIPRTNFEEILTSRARCLLPQESRVNVCEMLSLVPRRTAKAVAKRLKAFLVSTDQRVPFFLSCVPTAD